MGGRLSGGREFKRKCENVAVALAREPADQNHKNFGSRRGLPGEQERSRLTEHQELKHKAAETGKECLQAWLGVQKCYGLLMEAGGMRGET